MNIRLSFDEYWRAISLQITTETQTYYLQNWLFNWNKINNLQDFINRKTKYLHVNRLHYKTILNSYPLLKMKIEDDEYYYNNDE